MQLTSNIFICFFFVYLFTKVFARPFLWKYYLDKNIKYTIIKWCFLKQNKINILLLLPSYILQSGDFLYNREWGLKRPVNARCQFAHVSPQQAMARKTRDYCSSQPYVGISRNLYLSLGSHE